MAESEAADSLITEQQPEIISPLSKQKTSVSDTSDNSAQPANSIPNNHPEEKHTQSQAAIQERRALLKTWLATVIGTAIAFALVSGIKDLRALITTSMTAGSIGFVVAAFSNNGDPQSRCLRERR